VKVIQLFFIILICSIAIPLGNMSSAESSSYYFDINIVDKKSSGSSRMDWNLIFVTSWDKCSERNWKALEFYYYIAYQSIKQYKYDHALTWADCVSTDDMALAIQKSQDESDLPIIILDYSLSSKQRHTSNSLGHFAYAYNVKSIIMQAETLQIENKNTAWILSHEIAHSSLNWLDYSREIHRDAPHNVQAEYNYCKGTDVTLTYCTPIWDSVGTPSDSNYPIMKASYVLGIADSMKSISQQKNELPVSIFVSTDKTTYQSGDTITMKGKVNNFKENSKTFFQVIGPSGILRAVELIDLNSRGEFSISYPIDYIPTIGEHILTINHNNNVAEITFNIFNPAPITPQLDLRDNVKETANSFEQEYQKQMELEREKKKQERAVIHKKNVEILQKQEQVQESQEFLQKQEQEKSSLLESQILRDEFLVDVKDVEKGVEVSEKSLTGLVFQKKEAQEKINKAWDYLKENKKRINALHNYYLKKY